MDKREFFCLLLAIFSIAGMQANAQTSASAYQRIELHIQPSIEIAALKASEVQLSLKNDKVGKTSKHGHEFRIRSNKNFVVKASTYSIVEDADGEKVVTPHPSIKNNLQLAVANGTESNELGKYTSISNSPKDIIAKGRRGEQTFAVNYQVKRANRYNNDNYAVGVLYTATEP